MGTPRDRFYCQLQAADWSAQQPARNEVLYATKSGPSIKGKSRTSFGANKVYCLELGQAASASQQMFSLGDITFPLCAVSYDVVSSVCINLLL